MTTLIKLGGSLITDKRQARVFRRDSARQVLRQIKQIWESEDPPRLILGHGSGSFGHHEASKTGTVHGARDAADWMGFARVAEAASALSQLLLTECIALDLPALRLPPSALLRADDGRIKSLNRAPVIHALEAGLIPLLHGDVAFDDARGATIIATEQIFAALASQTDARQIILLGEVPGALDRNGRLLSTITPATISGYRSAFRGASGTDVTGGMAQKVREMLKLVVAQPSLRVVIADGRRPDVLIDLLCRDRQVGTVIRAAD